MCILSIPNRTENWKTAQVFSQLIANGGSAELAHKIISNNNNLPKPTDKQVHLELFWKGFRDYKHKMVKNGNMSDEELKEEAVNVYLNKFNDLQDNIKKTKTSLMISDKNYKNSDPGDLYSNLINTEIDIVMSVPGYLLIGEAKINQPFGAKSDHILTHQLVREYVMATIVATLASPEEITIIPFVVSEKNVKNCGQIKLMKSLEYLKEKNVMNWIDLEKIIKKSK